MKLANDRYITLNVCGSFKGNRLRTFGMTITILACLGISACSSSSNSSSGVGSGDMNGNPGSDTDLSTDTDENGGDACPAMPAAMIVDEAVIGDFSDDRLAPTALTFGPGANQINATTGGVETLDYITIEIGLCDTLDSITLDSYSGQDEIAFLGLQRGSTFTIEPQAAQSSRDQMLGFTHFGTIYDGQDLLTLASMAEGAAGFDAPLTAGNYTLWLQQFGTVSSYTMTFNVSRVASKR